MRTMHAAMLAFCFLLLCLFSPSQPGYAQAKPPKTGICFSAGEIGNSLNVDVLVDFVKTGGFSPVLIDWGVITASWPRCDFGAIEQFGKAIAAGNLPIYAVYTPRFKTDAEAKDIQFQQKEGKSLWADEREICYGHDTARAWGADWGKQILSKCPSVTHVAFWDLSMRCKCDHCMEEYKKDKEFHKIMLGKFIAESRTLFRSVNPKTEVGMVAEASFGPFKNLHETLDFAVPLLKVGEPTEAKEMIASYTGLQEKLKCKTLGAFASVIPNANVGLDTQRLLDVFAAAGEAGIPLVLSPLENVFLNKKLDQKKLCAALGLNYEALQPITGSLGASGMLMETLLQMLMESEQGDALENVAPMFSRFGNKALPDLKKILDNSANDKRYRAVFALAAIGTDEAVQLMIECLDNVGGNVRLAAVEKLGELGVMQAHDKIAELAETDPFVNRDDATGEKTFVVREAAQRALRKLESMTPAQLLLRSLDKAVLENATQALDSEIKWQSDIDEAKVLASSSNKPLLVAVSIDPNDDIAFKVHTAMLACLFTGSDVATLVQRRFVAAKINTSELHFLLRANGNDDHDPLAQIGCDTRDIKAQALIVLDPEGKQLGLLNGLAAYDEDKIYAWLREMLAKVPAAKAEGTSVAELLMDGDLEHLASLLETSDNEEIQQYALARIDALRSKHEDALKTLSTVAENSAYFGECLTQKGVSLMRLGRFAEALEQLTQAANASKHSRRAEALFYQGCLQHFTGDTPFAEKTWVSLIAEYSQSPYAGKALVVLHSPRINPLQYICLATSPEKNYRGSEYSVPEASVKEFIVKPLHYLLQRQQAEGNWMSGYYTQTHPAAYTAITLMAFETWKRHLQPAEQKTLETSIAAGRKILETYVDKNINGGNLMDMSYCAWYFLRCVENGDKTDATRDYVTKSLRRLMVLQNENGGWAHMNPMDTENTTFAFNTGQVLLLLATAKRLGFEVDATAIDKACEKLLSMRVAPGVYHYSDLDADSWMAVDNASIARGPLCELALFLHGKAEKADVASALELFLKHQGELREPVKFFLNGLNPKGHGSYFYLFGYHCAAVAARSIGDKKTLEQLYPGILEHVELDNGWVDCYAYGKVYGTAMASLTLGEIYEGSVK